MEDDDVVRRRFGRRTFILGVRGAAVGIVADRLLLAAEPAWGALIGGTAPVPRFDVDAYRAAGDPDDTAAVTRAVRAAEQAGGGDVVFSAREYLLSQITRSGTGFSWAVVVRGSGVRLVGQGDSTVVRSTADPLSRGMMLIWPHGGGRRFENVGDYTNAWAPGYPIIPMRPAAKGARIIELTTMSHGLVVGDWLFIRTGQTIPSGTSFQPDAELNQVTAVQGARVQLRFPLAKPYAQEYRPAGATASTTDPANGTPDPLGVHRVTDAILSNVRIEGLRFDLPLGTYWAWLMQTVGSSATNLTGRFCTGTIGVQYARTTVVAQINAQQTGIPPLHSLACGGAAGTTDLKINDITVVGERPSMIHLHEGVARTTVQRLHLSSPGGGKTDGGISLHGRAYDTLVQQVTIIGGAESSCLTIGDTCTQGGTIKACTLEPKANPAWAGVVKGTGWNILQNRSTKPIKVGPGNTALGNSPTAVSA